MDDQDEERFDAVLRSVGDRKISVLKLVREVLGLDSVGAKDFIESVPRTVKKNLPEDEARALQRRFDAVGADLGMESSPRP